MRSPCSWGHSHGLPRFVLGQPLPSHPSSVALPAAGHRPEDAFAGWWGGTRVAGALGPSFCNTPYIPSLPSQLFDSPVTHLGFS